MSVDYYSPQLPRTFTCDWCNHAMPVERSEEVLAVKCARCGKSLMVPPESKRPVQKSIMAPPDIVPSDPLPPLVAKRTCPFCGAPMTADATDCGCGFSTGHWHAKKQITREKKLKLALASLLAVVVMAVLGLTIYNAMNSLRHDKPPTRVKHRP